jgi:hypothetical protein
MAKVSGLGRAVIWNTWSLFSIARSAKDNREMGQGSYWLIPWIRE